MGNISAPIAELMARLAWHTTTADPVRLLNGVFYNPLPIVKVDGLSDLPAVSVFIPSFTDSYRAVNIVTSSVQFRFVVSTRRDAGLVAHAQLVEKVLDALEKEATTAARVNPNLDGTLKPFAVSVGNNFALDLSLNSQVTVTVEPRPVTRGTRRL